jgi:hypothetical protein
MTFAFNYSNNVDYNLKQQRDDLSIVTMLLTGDRGIVFRFPCVKRSKCEANLSHLSLYGIKEYSYIHHPCMCLHIVHIDITENGGR